MKLTKETLKRIIKEELDVVMNEAEMGESMNPSHPDYDMLGSLISRVFIAVIMNGNEIESAMDAERVPEEHRDYVRQKVMALAGR